MNEIQKEIYQYLDERNWLPNDQERNTEAYAKSICIEAAELLEQFQWNDGRRDQERILDELADVVIYCIDMAISLDVDIEDVIRNKLQKVREKYPADVVRDNSDASYKIKNDHRTKKG